jgi:hypothetical protein
VGFQELNRDNRRPYQRQPFAGDSIRVEESAARVREALSPFEDSDAQPAVEDVRQAISAVLPSKTLVEVTTTAFGLPGTAFGAVVGDGCVFGSIHQGTVTVEVGGYINDGGCLPILGH